jgi:outer membrane receptor protein involved in Fe transport
MKTLQMNRMRMRTRLMATSMITGAAMVAATGAARAADPTTPPASTTVQEVVITGSRIPTPNLTSVSPITSVNQQDVKLGGISNPEDLINSLPQAMADFGTYESNGASGTSTVNLRGLGNQRTLVLVNSARLMPGDPTRGAVAPDINIIPPALIDHVEVLTGGASAVYGSDAVAGVVNFIMKKNFEGLEIDEQTSFAQDDGGNKQVRQANFNGVSSAALGTAVPPIHFPGSAFDGWRQTVTVIGGVNAPDQKGNAEFYFGYTHIDPVLESKRDYSICSLATNTGNNVQWCAGSVGTTANGRLGVTTPGVPHHSYTILGTPTAAGLLPRFNFAQAFNYAPYNYYQRPDERWTAGQFSHYEFSPMFDVYSSFMFMDDHSVAAIAPSGSFFGDRIFTIPCNDPLLSSAQATTLCGPGPYAADQNGTATIGRRNVEGSPRLADFEHMDYRMQLGVRGDLGDGWRYDLSGQFGRSVLTESQPGYLFYPNVINALNVVTDPRAGSPTFGQPVCATVLVAGGDKACIPWNIWSPGGVTQAQLQYLYGNAADNGATQEQVVSLVFSNPDLSAYGLKSPMAHDGVGFSGGYEYRSEDLNLFYDQAITSGNLGGFGGALRSTNGNQSDNDLYFELRAPLVQDAEWAKDLDLEIGYRWANYTHGGPANAFKFGLDWQTVPDVRFRASFERAVRAPNVEELFEPPAQNLFSGSDPCAGGHPQLTPAQCANTFQTVLPGVTGAQLVSMGIYGNVAGCPASQCGTFIGGNPALKPEQADTYSVGFVFTPSFFHNFSLSIDYWNIKIDNAIVNLPAQALLTNCATLGNAFDCSLVQRFPQNGYTIFGGNTINFGDQLGGVVYAKLVNASSLKTDGVDVNGDYRLNLDDVGAHGMGSVAFSFNGTWLNHLTTTLPDHTSYECAGLYGIVCGVPAPHWRHNMRVTWNSPWNAQFSVNWRFIGPSSLDFNTSQPDVQNGFKDTLPTDANLSSWSYLDLAVSWRVKDHFTVRGGVNNVLDTDPPLVDANSFGISAPPFGNGNTWPQAYDPLGRVFFLGLTADF